MRAIVCLALVFASERLVRSSAMSDGLETAAFLLSPMSRGITGEILHVDAGYHVVGMKAIEAPDIDLLAAKKDAAQ